MKIKKYIILLIIIIFIVLLCVFILRFIVKYNYDVKIITDSGGSFFIFSSSNKEYYLINSNLGIKVPAEEFNTNKKISNLQLQNLEKISKIDNKFNLNQFDLDKISKYNSVFFYNDFIFYTRDTGSWDSKTMTSEDSKDFKENFYKYNINTEEIEKLKIQSNNKYSTRNIKLEALMYLYPNLDKAIENKTKRNYFYNIYFENDRILFTTGYSSNKVEDYYLFEYNPRNNRTRRITHTNAPITDVDILN